jgi:hypothetical protein
MKERPFYFEVKDIVTQFVTAFDDVVISRYNKQREEQGQLQVRYVYAPKQRVVHDLTNKNKHITLPAIAVNITGISRDPNRVFNKIAGSYHKRVDTFNGKTLSTKGDFLRPPIPINVEVSMSVLTRYQTDMDQILSNFIPYNNPYIIISWKIPSELLQQEQEIRSQVLWSGTIDVNYPTQLEASAPYRVSADTNFTIKGWLFKYQPADTSGEVIHEVTGNITPIIDIDDVSHLNDPL